MRTPVCTGYEPAVSRLLRLDHAPKCEIDTAVDSRRSLRHSMEPEALRLACHNEPMALLQFKRDCFLRPPMSELKPPRSTEGQARYRWAIFKTGFVVAVPSDAVTAMPIKIEQNGIMTRLITLRPFRRGAG